MKFTSKRLVEENKGQYIIQFELEEWKSILKSAKNKLTSQIEIPGFRKGKAPEDLVKKHLSDAKILNEAHKIGVEKAWTFALDQKDELWPFTQPNVNINTLSMTAYEISFEFDLKPEIKVENYKNIKVKKLDNTIKAEDVDLAIKQLQDRLAIVSVKEAGTIANGDIVVFDFEGFEDEKPFAGGNAKDFNLEIGSKRFIPGFEEQLIGLKAEEEKEFQITFPKDYMQADLAGKDVTFKVKIKTIKTKTIPEINDELAKDANLEGVTNLVELKEFISKNLEKQNEEKNKESFINDLLQEIAKTSTIHIPESIIDKEVTNLKSEFEEKLKSQGIDLKTYMNLTKLTDEAIDKELYSDAKVRITNFLILEEIMRQENISIDEEEINKEIAEFAVFYKMSEAEVKEKIAGSNVIEEGLKRRKLLDFLFENNG